MDSAAGVPLEIRAAGAATSHTKAEGLLVVAAAAAACEAPRGSERGCDEIDG